MIFPQKGLHLRLGLALCVLGVVSYAAAQTSSPPASPGSSAAPAPGSTPVPAPGGPALSPPPPSSTPNSSNSSSSGTTPSPTTPAQNAAPTPPAASTASPDDNASVQTIEINARPALVLAGNATWEDGYKTIMDALAKVKDAAAKNNLAATGHPVTAFVDTDDNGFKFEAMLPIDKAPEGKTDLGNGVKVGSTPAGKALKFQHRGAYEDIDTTYEAITAYLDEKGLEAQNVFVEEYLNDPKSAEDADAQIDIYVLIK